MLSHVWLFATSWTVVNQASLSMEFSRQEYWSGLPFPSLGNLPNPGIEPTSLLCPVSLGRIFTSWVTGEDFWINTSFWTKAEVPILWPHDAKNWLIGKDLDAGKDWRQEEKGTIKDEMVGWHHWLDGHGFGWTPGVGDRQGGLACCSSWGHKELDMTEWLNWWAQLYAESSKYSLQPEGGLGDPQHNNTSWPKKKKGLFQECKIGVKIGKITTIHSH